MTTTPDARSAGRAIVRRGGRGAYRLARLLLGYVARLRLPFRRTPTSVFGGGRGTSIDRYYIDEYLGRFGAVKGYSSGAIQGRVLEIGGRYYADRFGAFDDTPGLGVVTQVDVLHVNAANPEATFVGSLTGPPVLPDDTFDCIICTQTLHEIYDYRVALRALHAALAPGGVLLLTTPGITRACSRDRDEWGDWWRFTGSAVRRLLEEVFDAEHVYVESYGNVLSAVSFVHGLAAEDLRPAELADRDPDFEVIVAARAVKAAA
jgi:SAM-dependent methyltransferase